MGLFGMTNDNTDMLLFGMSLVGLILGTWAILMSFAGYTVDLTSSRPLVYPLRDSLARPWDLVLNPSRDLPNPYKGWTNDLLRSLPHGDIADYK